MMGKILFIDVDGTLVDYQTNLPESAVTAIRRARARGHRVYICTGRSKAEVYSNIWDIGLDGMIGGNGSYVEDHDTVVMHQLITPSQARHIVDWLHSRGLEFYLESNSGLYALSSILRATAGFMRASILRRVDSKRFGNTAQEKAVPLTSPSGMRSLT